MSPLVFIILSSWLAGLMAYFGGLIANANKHTDTTRKREITHAVIAFGGGILLAAVAFALVPEALVSLSPGVLGTTFCAGGVVFCIIDFYLAKNGGTKSQFMVMVLDFVPEAIALGAVFGHDKKLGLLLAGFIGAQNFPEGFNAFIEMRKDEGINARSALKALLFVSVLGPIASCIGYFILQDNKPLTSGIMAFAAGGITYLIFQDIAPQSKLRKHWSPALGAVVGFAIGMIGKQLLQ